MGEDNREEYIGGYYDFQKYLIDPEFRKGKNGFAYLTKEFGIGNLNPFEIFIIRFEMEIVDFCDYLDANEGTKSFLADIYTTLTLSRSKAGFGAKLLVSQITKGQYDIKDDRSTKTRFLNFGKKQQDQEKGYIPEGRF